MGADQLIDYGTQQWWESPTQFDAVFECVGSPGNFARAERKLPKGGVFVSCDRVESGGMVGGVFASIVAKIASPIHYVWFLNEPSSENLSKSATLLEQGKWPSALGKTFPFLEADKAFELSRSKKATGKIVVSVP